jgi:uncharacterized membrane protein
VSLLRRYLIAGLLVWLPIWATLVILKFLVDMMDNTLRLIPVEYQPDRLLGFHIPGLGLLISLAILILTGMLVSNFIGAQLVAIGEYILAKIPLVRTIYSAVKKVLETLFKPSDQSFRKVLLVEYPRKGLWSIAFQTGNGSEELNNVLNTELISIFIPTTPNPTSGFLMLVPRSEVIELEMNIEDALKYVISLGVVQPGTKKPGEQTIVVVAGDTE